MAVASWLTGDAKEREQCGRPVYVDRKGDGNDLQKVQRHLPAQTGCRCIERATEITYFKYLDQVLVEGLSITFWVRCWVVDIVIGGAVKRRALQILPKAQNLLRSVSVPSGACLSV